MTEDNVQFKIMEEDESELYKLNSGLENVDKNPFDTLLHEYLSTHTVKLYILTPCFGGVCHVNYVVSLMNMIHLFKSLNIQLQVEFVKNDSLVSRARNNLIARAMTDPESTHFLFIDNDITWNPLDVLKLIVADKDLVGGAYPLKHYYWERLLKDPHHPFNTNIVQSWVDKKKGSQLSSLIEDVDMVKYNLLRYNINLIDGTLAIENNIAKVKHLATGFMMIKRKMISSMMKAFPSTKYQDDINYLRPEENEMAYALFDCGVEDGHYYSEDWLFCDRWTKMGGDIFVDVSINLTHTGVEDYNGSFVSTII